MNKDINSTLAALVPILRMNGEKIQSIEAVRNFYKAKHPGEETAREYCKEVAEITTDSGAVIYADIGGDANLTAVYDVLAVIQQIKPRSKCIERIERGIYPPAAKQKLETVQCNLLKVDSAGRVCCVKDTCDGCPHIPGECAIEDLVQNAGLFENWKKCSFPNFREREEAEQ